MTARSLRRPSRSALAVLVCLALTGCGGGTSETGAANQDDASGTAPVVRDPEPAPVSPRSSEPEGEHPVVLRLEPETIDLGILDPTKSQEFDVVLHNLGDRLIFLQNVTTGCKCLDFEFESPRLEAHGSVTLHGRIRGKAGIAKVKFTVFSTCREQPSIGGLVTMTSTPTLRIEPKKLDLSDCRRGTPVERELVVRYLVPRGGPAFPIAPILGIDAPLTCEEVEHGVAASGDVDDQHEHRFRLRLDTTAEVPYVKGDVLFQGEGYESVTVPVEVCVHDGFRCDTTSLHLGSLAVGEHRTRTVRVHTYAETPVTVRSATSDLPGLTVQATIAAEKDLVLLELDYTATEPGEHSGTVRVDLDCAARPFELPVSVRVR